MSARAFGLIMLMLAILGPAQPVHGQAARPLAVDVLSVRSAEVLRVVFEGRTEELRLDGIDVAWCMLPEARLRLDGLARSRVGLLQLSQPSYDDAGRVLGYLWVDGTLMNELLVAEGYAVPTSTGLASRYQAELRGAVRLARGQTLGLWEYCPPASS